MLVNAPDGLAWKDYNALKARGGDVHDERVRPGLLARRARLPPALSRNGGAMDNQQRDDLLDIVLRALHNQYRRGLVEGVQPSSIDAVSAAHRDCYIAEAALFHAINSLDVDEQVVMVPVLAPPWRSDELPGHQRLEPGAE